jgi:hypothetical protein
MNSRLALFVLLPLVQTGCRDMMDFKAYDYKSGQSAELQEKQSGYRLGLKNDHLVLRHKTDFLSPMPDKGIRPYETE